MLSAVGDISITLLQRRCSSAIFMVEICLLLNNPLSRVLRIPIAYSDSAENCHVLGRVNGPYLAVIYVRVSPVNGPPEYTMWHQNSTVVVTLLLTSWAQIMALICHRQYQRTQGWSLLVSRESNLIGSRLTSRRTWASGLGHLCLPESFQTALHQCNWLAPRDRSLQFNPVFSVFGFRPQQHSENAACACCLLQLRSSFCKIWHMTKASGLRANPSQWSKVHINSQIALQTATFNVVQG